MHRWHMGAKHYKILINVFVQLTMLWLHNSTTDLQAVDTTHPAAYMISLKSIKASSEHNQLH